MRITIHKKKDFEAMRKAGLLAKDVLDYIDLYVKPGVSTLELNNLCHDFIISKGAIPAPLHYKGFPKSICTSVNHVICHGIPSSSKILKNGDILNIDVTIILNGWHGDTSRMYKIGKISKKAELLIDATYESLMNAIDVVKEGAHLGDIGDAIQSVVEPKGFSVVRDFCGHGIGKIFHTAPQVLHYGKKGEGIQLKEGMFFTIEPMINAGKYESNLLKDGWTAVTKDKSLSAQFEHTLGVTKDGCEVFTA